MINLVEYRLMRRPDIGPVIGTLFEYVFAGNGTFIRAKREGLEVCFPVGHCSIRGLYDLKPYVRMAYPKAPAALLDYIHDVAYEQMNPDGTKLEILFYLKFENEKWKVTIPPQHQEAATCHPNDNADPDYLEAFIELHSHHKMNAFFSGTDNQDEQGFRLYAVIGKIFTRPEIRVRVGCYGHFYEIPAEEIFELTDEFIHDESPVCCEEEDLIDATA